MFQSSAADHNRHCRILSPDFSDKSLRDHEPTITKHADMLVQRLRGRPGNSLSSGACLVAVIPSYSLNHTSACGLTLE